jgi:hypothetical protein
MGFAYPQEDLDEEEDLKVQREILMTPLSELKYRSIVIGKIKALRKRSD